MLNWIANRLVIKEDFSNVKKAYDQVKSAVDGFDFNGIISMPPHQPDKKKPTPSGMEMLERKKEIYTEPIINTIGRFNIGV